MTKGFFLPVFLVSFFVFLFLLILAFKPLLEFFLCCFFFMFFLFFFIWFLCFALISNFFAIDYFFFFFLLTIYQRRDLLPAGPTIILNKIDWERLLYKYFALNSIKKVKWNQTKWQVKKNTFKHFRNSLCLWCQRLRILFVLRRSLS